MAITHRSGPQSGSIPGSAPEVGARDGKERADAARNRSRILDAARQLFADRGPEHVSMEDVARGAGVGKGTLYRRFGDKAGLAMALLDEEERRLQEAAIRGPAPLGPSAAPLQRLEAFLDALVDLLEAHTELHVVSHHATPGARYRSALYGFYRRHVALLVGELRPDLDAGVVADLLLAPLAADAYLHLRLESAEPERVKDGLHALVEGLARRGDAGRAEPVQGPRGD
jgi:AcrR family transcriptional regulator